MGKRPEPMQAPADAPLRFVGRDYRAPADRRTQMAIGGLRLIGHMMQRADHGAPRHRQLAALREERGDLPERHAELPVEGGRPRQGRGPQLDGRGAQRIGRLPRMDGALHATATRGASTDVDAKPPHDRATGGRSSWY